MEQLYLQRWNIFCITTPKIILNSKPYKPQAAHMKFCHTRHLGPCPNALKHLATAQIHLFQHKSHSASHTQIYSHIHLDHPTQGLADPQLSSDAEWRWQATRTKSTWSGHQRPRFPLGKHQLVWNLQPAPDNDESPSCCRKDSVLNMFDGSSGTRQTIMSTWISSHTPPDYYFRKKPHKNKPV